MEIKPQDIKDFLHLYIGCEVAIKGHKNAILGAVGIDYGNRVIVRWPLENEWSYADVNEIKPILRKLSDMTEEEKEKLFDHLWPTGLWGIAWSGKIDVIDHILDLQDHWSDLGERVQNILSIKVMSAMLNWLRKNSFDADGLIPAGLAIDKTSLKN